MAKFKRGDGVRNLEATEWVPKGATGTVDEDDDLIPNVVWDKVTERAAKAFPEDTTFPQNEDCLELIEEQANTTDPLGIIGKKMKGFKFDGFKYNYLNYHLNMNKHIGNEGEIVSYMEECDCYYCKFSDREWAYPAKLIMQHIVDTPQELTLLEKFEQGWEIMELHNGFRIIDIAKTIKGRYFVKWSDGKIEQYDDLILNAVTCTPPKERKTLYLYERDEKTSFCVTTVKFPECGIITEIHLEKNGDNWEVVKP